MSKLKIKLHETSDSSRDRRKYQIILLGDSSPFFSSDDKQRWQSQIKHLDNLITQGNGKGYTAYENGKPVRTKGGKLYTIVLRGDSKPFFHSESEERWLEQIKHLNELSEEGKGIPYKAYANGKLEYELSGVINAINKDYSKRRG